MKLAISTLLFSLLFVSTRSQVTVNFETGIYFVSIENVSDGGDGDIISYPYDFGIIQVPNFRAGVKWNFKRNLVYGKAVLFQFRETAQLDEPKVYEGYKFPAGTPIDIDYKFNGYRIGYAYKVLEEDKFHVWVGLTLNIRQGLIRFDDGEEMREFSKDPVPLVPLINNFVYYRPVDWFSFNTEIEFFYFSPDGWVFDALFSANFYPAKWLGLYTGYRGFGGNGYSEGKFENRLWANTWAVGINIIIPNKSSK